MRLTHLLTVPAAAGAIILLGVSSASAGEIGGSGKPTQGPAHANSICVFSGLEDGGEGGPSGPGVAPQNWGHVPRDLRPILAAQGEHPGDACNGHTGFLSGGGGEPAP